MSDAVEPEDIVLVCVRGRTFYARVLGAERLGRLAIAPLDPAVRARSAQVSDLRGHWRHQGDPRPPTADDKQASFDHLLDH
ncbi:hypothetical protein OM076_02070 [Solirubrobacter ginsenosidimutans]|uniref:Uncharacterized protein n=1 Tax=Solirubrobacter ginsenosidimutans TaxID=490573 RepID=A0A9X3MNL7_9ACTN|nr:hypothetical protein [Solirubrobacter ginsenosidimutans]MDA0159037.1 hypothetical protein [Solirubrobacter ginsenosidimutans]